MKKLRYLTTYCEQPENLCEEKRLQYWDSKDELWIDIETVEYECNDHKNIHKPPEK